MIQINPLTVSVQMSQYVSFADLPRYVSVADSKVATYLLWSWIQPVNQQNILISQIMIRYCWYCAVLVIKNFSEKGGNHPFLKGRVNPVGHQMQSHVLSIHIHRYSIYFCKVTGICKMFWQRLKKIILVIFSGIIRIRN